MVKKKPVKKKLVKKKVVKKKVVKKKTGKKKVVKKKTKMELLKEKIGENCGSWSSEEHSQYLKQLGKDIRMGWKKKPDPLKKKVVDKKPVEKKEGKRTAVTIFGQNILELIVGGEYNYLDFLEYTDAILYFDEENCCETFQVREEKSWRVDITVHYKDRGGDEDFPDSPRWDCNSVDVYFMGNGKDFKKWLKNNWKEGYKSVNWI